MKFLEALEKSNGKPFGRKGQEILYVINVYSCELCHLYSDETTKGVFNRHFLDLVMSKADDWVIVEEPKATVWKARGNTEEFKSGVEVVSINKVKEALKAFIEFFYSNSDCFEANRYNVKMEDKAKQIFGEELLK